MAMHNIPMTAEQLEELMSAAVQMQCDSEKAGEREVSIFAYAVQVAVSEIRKVREELTAAHSTLEKAREVTNCPDGVDLQEHLKALVAENVALKNAAEFSTAPDMWIEQADGMLDYRYVEWYVDVLKAAMETPATDAFLAEVRAHDLNAFIQHHSTELDAHIKNGGENFDEKSIRIRDIIVSALLFREKLRQGAAL